MVKYQFAINKPQTLEDGTVLPVKLVPRNNHDLFNKHDKEARQQCQNCRSGHDLYDAPIM
jgi:hypothetical protein